MNEYAEILARESVEASAPCRIDMGGTLDLSTFFLPLHHLEPCTFNAALDMRTHVRLAPWKAGRLKISSRGFESLDVEAAHAPFAHPLGLMMAVCAYYQVDGVHIHIESTSPPRSALGGSSVAAAALIWALSKVRAHTGAPMPGRSGVALLAHAIEQSVAGVPCGLQDQLAAVFGGVNAWYWRADPAQAPYRRVELLPPENVRRLADRVLLAYCGAPHESKDINSTWVRQFVTGQERAAWKEIAQCGHDFVAALASDDLAVAIETMNRETDMRIRLTPEVLDETGKALVTAARENDCAARFTGAGGGGCVWALGPSTRLAVLKSSWERILAAQPSARLLPVGIDTDGLL